MRHRISSFGFRLIVIVAVVAWAPLGLRSAGAALAPGDCVDFEDLQLGTVYNVPANFVASATTVTTSQFQWSNGIWTSAGHADVEEGGLSGGTGLELEVNNITLNFAFGRAVENLRLFFGEYGGNVNLTVNGDFRNVGDFGELDQTLVGGVLVEVNLSPTGLGLMVLDGDVNSFSIGGQELWIDDVCDAVEPTGCVEFEDLPLGEAYEYGQFFVDSGVGMLVDEFVWYPSGTTYSDGYATVYNSQTAGGTGQDLYPNNCTIFFGIDEPLAEVSLLYNDRGGNINLVVNDVLANSPDLVDLHNTTVGGALVTLEPATGTTGTLTVTGSIESFAIGGQETWIDHVCGVPSEIFFDDFESGGTSAWSSAVGGP